jgi:hypothetical protein
MDGFPMVSLRPHPYQLPNINSFVLIRIHVRIIVRVNQKQ